MYWYFCNKNQESIINQEQMRLWNWSEQINMCQTQRHDNDRQKLYSYPEGENKSERLG